MKDNIISLLAKMYVSCQTVIPRDGRFLSAQNNHDTYIMLSSVWFKREGRH